MNILDQLNESLKNDIPWMYTSDTNKSLKKFYVVYELDDVRYGCSLCGTTHDGVYLLAMYRLPNKNAKYWSFKSLQHMRKSIALALEFVSDTIDNVKTSKTDIKAILIEPLLKITFQYRGL